MGLGLATEPAISKPIQVNEAKAKRIGVVADTKNSINNMYIEIDKTIPSTINETTGKECGDSLAIKFDLNDSKNKLPSNL